MTDWTSWPLLWSKKVSGRVAWLLATMLLLGGCGSVRYYAQAVRGQGALVTQRQSIDVMVRAPGTSPALAARLRLAQDARRFATTDLDLPDNRSYTRYVDLHRPFVVWNVFVAPPYSVNAVSQCFPVAGCVAYRGWFSAAAADADAARWKQRGMDVWVGGVSAYSTLGWFADPIVSSMLRWDDDELIGTIFHELAHQKLYVKGDTAFNESFATFVQRQGVRQWHLARGLPPPGTGGARIDAGFTHLVLDLRERLRVLYASGADKTSLALAKQREIAAFRQRYVVWRDSAGADASRYDRWAAGPINNASLLPFGLYEQWTPAFAALFGDVKCIWPAFYARVKSLTRKPKSARDRTLQGLMDRPRTVPLACAR
ncbi:MAG: aminopeptidase [Rhodanobacter sp.]